MLPGAGLLPPPGKSMKPDWREQVTDGQDWPRIAYLHIYKLVCSSDSDYKVQEETVEIDCSAGVAPGSAAAHVGPRRGQLGWDLGLGLQREDAVGQLVPQDIQRHLQGEEQRW